MANKITCPEGHTKVWKKGAVPTRHGLKVRYLCYTCGRSFYAPVPEKKRKSKKAKS